MIAPADTWLRALELDGKRPYTLRAYHAALKLWLAYCEREGLNPLTIATADFRGWMATQATLARKTRTHRVGVLKLWYRWLHKQGLTDRDLLHRYHSGRRGENGKRLPVVLTLPEIDRLLDAPPSDSKYGIRDRALLEVLYGTGMRLGELEALDLRDLDLKRRTLFIRDGKGGKSRTVLFGEPCARALGRYLVEAHPVLRGKNAASPALWIGLGGRRIGRKLIDATVRAAAEAAGIERTVSAHTLRHSYATHLMDRGMSERCLQELLGHANVKTTGHYVSVSKAALAASSDRAWRTLERRKLRT